MQTIQHFQTYNAGMKDIPKLITEFDKYRRFGWEAVNVGQAKKMTAASIYRTEKAIQKIEDAYNALTHPMFLQELANKTGELPKTIEKRLVILMQDERVKREKCYSEYLNRMMFKWSRA